MNAVSHNPELISVIIPAYNAERWICETLQSVQSQSYKNIEILVIDDGSTDSTAECVRRVARLDARVQLLQQVNSGVAAARNLGIMHSKGDWIAPIDADDLWKPQKLAKQVECMRQGGESMALVYCYSQLIDEHGLCLRNECEIKHPDGFAFHYLIVENFIGNGSCPLMRKSSVLAVGGYDTRLHANNAQGCEDWKLYLEIAACSAIGVVREFLVGYRQIQSSMSKNIWVMQRSHRLMLESVVEKYPNVPLESIRESKTAILFWMILNTRKIGSVLFRLSFTILRIDPFFFFRTRARNAINAFLLTKWSQLKSPAFASKKGVEGSDDTVKGSHF